VIVVPLAAVFFSEIDRYIRTFRIY